MKRIAALALLCFCTSAALADATPHWCPPDGPQMPNEHPADNPYMMKPGWVTYRMHVKPGAVPVEDVRVVSEAGGSGHALNWGPLVRQWVGCAANERDTIFEMTFTLGVRGNYQVPKREGFGLHAFQKPKASPALPADDWGVGVCPIAATIQLRQPQAPNVVVELEGKGGKPVTDWLEQLVPNLDYMTPSPKSNRVEFGCKVDKGVLSFFE